MNTKKGIFGTGLLFFILLIFSCNMNIINFIKNDVTSYTAGDKLIPEFTASPVSGSAPLSVQFTNVSSGPITSYAWDFNGDGITDSTEKAPVFTFTSPGLYSVKLTVADSGGKTAERLRTNYITAYGSVVADFDSELPTQGYAPLSINFNDLSSSLSTETITSWAWDFDNNGITDSTEQNPTHIFNLGSGEKRTQYTVKLTVTGAGGQDEEIKANFITVYQPLNADFTANVTQGDAPLNVTFSDTSTGYISSRAWDFDNNGTTDSTLQNPAHSFTRGKYTVKLTVTDPLGTNSEIKTNYINAYGWHGIKQIGNDVISENYMGSIDVYNDNVYISYSSRNDTSQYYLWFDKSTDAGEHFTNTYIASGMMGGESNDDEFVNTTIKANSTQLYLAYGMIHITPPSTITDSVRFKKSADSGANWSTPLSLVSTSGPTSYDFLKPAMSTYSNRIYIDTYSGGTGISYKGSTNGGDTFLDNSTLDTSTNDQIKNISFSSYATKSGTTLYAAYFSNHTTSGASFNRIYCSKKDALNFKTLATVAPADANSRTAIKVKQDSVDGDDIFICYIYSGNLQCAFSTTGISGSWTVRSPNNANNCDYPAIVIDGSNIYISYYNTSAQELKFIKSTDYGNNWQTLVTVDTTGNVGKASCIAVNDEIIYITYYDAITSSIKLAKSVNYGDNWN